MNNAVKLLIDAIKNNELHYYQATGSFAYAVRYEDGELSIVYNSLSAKEARPGVEFEMVASARWLDNLGNPAWVVVSDGACFFINTDEYGKWDEGNDESAS